MNMRMRATLGVLAWAGACVAAAGVVQPVVLIGLDGLGGDWFDQAAAPRLQALARAGTATLVMQVRPAALPVPNLASANGSRGGAHRTSWARARLRTG
jgi:hypothetical protein